MADTSVLDPFSAKPTETNNVSGAQLDRMGFLDEFGAELVPDPHRLVSDGGQFIKEGFNAIKDLLYEDVAFIQTPEQTPRKPMSATGSIENFQTAHAKSPELLTKEREANYQRVVYANLEEARRNTQRFAHERTLGEAVRLEVSTMSTEEKNRALHLSLDLNEKNISDPYHTYALREKKKEDWRKLEEKKKNTAILSPAKRPSALETMFEGGSGTQGSGQGNLSFQATG